MSVQTELVPVRVAHDCPGLVALIAASDHHRAQRYQPRLLHVAVIGKQIKMNTVLSTLRLAETRERTRTETRRQTRPRGAQIAVLRRHNQGHREPWSRKRASANRRGGQLHNRQVVVGCGSSGWPNAARSALLRNTQNSSPSGSASTTIVCRRRFGGARLLGYIADISRFRSKAHFASWNGTAPDHPDRALALARSG